MSRSIRTQWDNFDDVTEKNLVKPTWEPNTRQANCQCFMLEVSPQNLKLFIIQASKSTTDCTFICACKQWWRTKNGKPRSPVIRKSSEMFVHTLFTIKKSSIGKKGVARFKHSKQNWKLSTYNQRTKTNFRKQQSNRSIRHSVRESVKTTNLAKQNYFSSCSTDPGEPTNLVPYRVKKKQ